MNTAEYSLAVITIMLMNTLLKPENKKEL